MLSSWLRMVIMSSVLVMPNCSNCLMNVSLMSSFRNIIYMYIVLSHTPWLLALTLEIIWFSPHYTVDW